MKRLMLMCAIFTVAASLAATNPLELKQICDGEFASETLSEVRPMADGESYAQISKDGRKIVISSFKTGKPTGTLFDASTVRGPKLERIDGYVVSPDERNVLIQTETKYIYRRSFTAVYYIYNVRNHTMTPLSDGGPQQVPVFSPDGNQVAFVRDNNIWLVKLLYDNAESQVTKDGKRNTIINGVPDWVNEEEFATNCSMVFTADSRQLVWIRYDESAVKEYALPLSSFSYKYPQPGDANSKVSVMSYDIKSHQTRTMQLPLGPEDYVPRIVATSDASKVAVFTLNRHQDCLRIFMANPLSTICQQVIEERADKYVREEAMNAIRFASQHILMPSDRDGFNHLYLYSLSGKLLRQVEQGHYEVSDVYGYDEKTGDTYFSADMEGAADRQIYVARANGRVERLTRNNGVNQAVFSSSFRYFLNLWSDLNTPPQYTLNNNSGKTLATLIDNESLRQKLASYQLGSRELFTLTTADEITLNGWMVKPNGFDPQKKYPVIMYQYGGPGSQQVMNRWGIGMCGQGAIFEQLLAQQGYLCVCIDNRGTGGRGAEFEKCTYLRLGELESHDQVEAALWLSRQSYVDKDRIAIWGWSYGGWNTLMSMSEGRGVFRCGVAIAPPTNWRFYDTVYTERYMRTPQENPTGYDEVNPIARASKLHGALLLVHGLADDNVHFQNTAEYTDALIDADKDFRQLVYNGRNHSIRGGNTRNHLFRQIIDFFNSHLKK